MPIVLAGFACAPLATHHEPPGVRHRVRSTMVGFSASVGTVAHYAVKNYGAHPP
jgi:hypothetical protein